MDYSCSVRQSGLWNWHLLFISKRSPPLTAHEGSEKCILLVMSSQVWGDLAATELTVKRLNSWIQNKAVFPSHLYKMQVEESSEINLCLGSWKGTGHWSQRVNEISRSATALHSEPTTFHKTQTEPSKAAVKCCAGLSLQLMQGNSRKKCWHSLS